MQQWVALEILHVGATLEICYAKQAGTCCQYQLDSVFKRQLKIKT